MLDVWTAEQVYQRETRVLPRWLAGLLPTLAFIMADNSRIMRERRERFADFIKRFGP